jgi:hypothetical protein
MTKARDLANASTALSAVSATELGYVDGVTSAIQTQLDGKQAVNANVSTTELGYLDGVTSAVQTQLDAKIPKTLTTTTGDIIYASSANTPARLGIGSTDQVLKVSGGVPTWATPASSGGMTVIASGTMSSTSLLISSIPDTYVDLVLEMDSFIHNVANWGWALRLNDDNNANRYYNSTAFATVGGAAFNASQISITVDNGTVSSNGLGKIRVLIPSYAVSTSWKMVQAYGLSQVNATPANLYFQVNAGLYNQTAAISSMRIVPTTGATIGGSYTLYGVK